MTFITADCLNISLREKEKKIDAETLLVYFLRLSLKTHFLKLFCTQHTLVESQ